MAFSRLEFALRARVESWKHTHNSPLDPVDSGCYRNLHFLFRFLVNAYIDPLVAHRHSSQPRVPVPLHHISKRARVAGLFPIFYSYYLYQKLVS